MVLTHFARPHNFCSFLSLPASPCKFFVLNPRKRLHLRKNSGGFELVLGKKMCSLKFLKLTRKGKEEHSVCCCSCREGSQSEAADMKLEAEILAFMEKSQNPDAFPTRKDLEKAGRVNLIEARRNRGGWYSFGWDSEEEPTGQENIHKAEAEEIDFDIEELRRRVEKYQESDSGSDFSFGDSSQPASSSGRSLILNRLEKERTSSLGINTSKYGYGANHSSRDNIDDRSSGTTTADRTDLGKRGSLTTFSPKKGSLSDSGGQLNHKYTPAMWRSRSTQRACPEGTECEIGEVDFDKRPDGGKTETSRDDVFTIKENSYEALERWIYNNHNDIRTRFQHLELELSSTLHSLRSKSQEFSSKEVLGRSPNDLQNLSDAREFQENDVINAQKRLQSLRAKLAILEWKVALTLTDAEKLLAKKQKRIDSASKAFQFLRTTQIVWHNAASERKIEKLRTGVFTVSLKLYPGSYEIKFIVDGIWKLIL